MSDVATRALIGRTVGGSPGELDDVAAWVRDTLQPIVEDVGATLDGMIEKLPEVWSDQNAAYFVGMLAQGRNDTNELADRLGAVADLVGGTGPAIRAAQSRLDEVVSRADGGEFEVTEEGIWSYYDLADDWKPRDVDIIAEWHELCEQADVALEPLATQMETMADSNIWATALLASGSIVSQSTKRLLDDYGAKGGAMQNRLPQLRGTTFGFQRMGLLKRGLGYAGPVIDGLQAINSVREGKRPDQVLIEFGVGAVAGGFSAAAGAAAVGALVAGSAIAPVLLAGAAVTFGYMAVRGPEYVGDQYIRVLPDSVAARLRRSGATETYEDEGEIRWDGGVYGP